MENNVKILVMKVCFTTVHNIVLTTEKLPHLPLSPLAGSSPGPPDQHHPSVGELEVVTLLPQVLLALR